MNELFGVSMTYIMVALLAIFLPAMAIITVLAWRNRVMVKLGIRNIPRRPAQTVLIIFGITISTLVISAAFGIGDSLHHSIRSIWLEGLGSIDEIVVLDRADSEDSFGSGSYFPEERFRQLQRELAGLDLIDGLVPYSGETAPTVNSRTSLSEGRMRVVGIDPAHLAGFDPFTLTSGGEVFLQDLAEDEGYINKKAAEELDALAGDELRLSIDSQVFSFTVKGIVDRGGLAGFDSTLLIPLERAQRIFNKRGQINFIAVSNRGGVLSGADASEEVTKRLRVLFADREVAARLQGLLNWEDVLEALATSEESLTGHLQEDVSQLQVDLQREGVSEELISLLSDDDIRSEVRDTVTNLVRRAETSEDPSLDNLQELERQVDTQFIELGEFRVLELKRRALERADETGSGVTTFFIVMGLFSIMVGILLIFLIFVMLAAARRSEMGMARAVGAKRQHLVQMFVFEGTAYSLLAAAVGVLLGLGVSAVMIFVANQIISGVEEDFRFIPHFTVRSTIVAFCLGMVITLTTVAVSSYRVSQMNIVAAVRGLPPPTAVSTTGWWEIVVALWRAFLLPFRLGWRIALALVTLHPLRALAYLPRLVWAELSVPVVFIKSVVQILSRPFRQGWLVFILGVLLAAQGINIEQAAPFGLGVSLMIIGLGLTLRTILERTSMRAEVRDRIVYTFIGVVMLIFWLKPFDALDGLVGELEGGIEMFFLSGISVVAAAVWTVMYNADLILRGLNFLMGRFSGLRPVLVTAIAYPMSTKFRTGLTLAMFSLVIFTLTIMSILNSLFGSAIANDETVTGKWDIQGDLNPNTPIQDIRQAINARPSLSLEDFTAIGGYTTIPIQARQLEAEEQRWKQYALRAADDEFLESTGYRLKLIADGYGPTEREVWQALREDPTLVVVDAPVVPTHSGFGGDNWASFQLEGLFYEDDSMSPIEIEIRERRSGVVARATVIGVLDQVSDVFGEIGWGMFTSKKAVGEEIPFTIPITTYRFRITEGVDIAGVSRNLEASFQAQGMETEVLQELVDEQVAANRGFNYLLTAFMSLGLMVGIASLGVVSTRAVVERRQQIGVLRAIGYRRYMVQLSFLLESSFVALLGVAMGVGLGTIISYHIFNDIQEDFETLRFTFPWVRILAIVAGAYLFSLVATFLPARQASRIYPAEALRYE